MKTSFIIPLYNCAQYLEDCVLQIKNINLLDYEIILVDDGSTDNSAIICDRLSHMDKRICCIHQKNQGVSAARNRGLETASGDYVLFLDADDTIESEKLLFLLTKLEKESNVDMVIFSMSFDYYHNGVFYRRDELKSPISGVQNSSLWINKMQALFYANLLSPIWNKIIRRKLLIDNNLYLRKDMFLYEDLEYSLRCMAYCDDILFEPEIIYHYRQNEDAGNTYRRLMRVEHISSLINQIEGAFNELISKQHVEKKQNDIKTILLTLYLTLAREKIESSDAQEIGYICDDFAEWYYAKKIFVYNNAFIDKLVNRKVVNLILNREYTIIRHKIAVIVKSTILYRKWKG